MLQSFVSFHLAGDGSFFHFLCWTQPPQPERFFAACSLLSSGTIRCKFCNFLLSRHHIQLWQSRGKKNPGLFFKLANIMVSEKRAWAVAHNPVLLIQFLDATAVFDRKSHPVILSHLFNKRVVCHPEDCSRWNNNTQVFAFLKQSFINKFSIPSQS